MYFQQRFLIKGTQMGLLLVLVCPCFREHVIVTCKIVSFLCNLDNFLLKNVIIIIFFFWKSNFKMALIWKRGCFWHTFHRKDKKFLQHISHLHTDAYFAHPIDFFALLILQKLQIYLVWFLFGMTPGVDSFSHHFEAINK